MDKCSKNFCPNCSQLYDITSITPQLKGRIPLLLQCGHSTCETCIKNITKFAEPYECKICHDETKLEPDDLKVLSLNPTNIRKKFPINSFLLGELIVQLTENPANVPTNNDFFVDLKYILRTTDTTVGTCVECKVPSPLMCKQCESVLCDVCFNKIHKNFQSLRNHTRQNIAIPVEPGFCQIHKDKPADYYCTQCFKSICMTCTIVSGENSCKNHSVVPVEEKNLEFLDELKTIAPKVDEAYRRITQTAFIVGNSLQDLSNDTSEKGTNKLVMDAKNHFCKLHAIIQKQETDFLATVDKLIQSEFHSLLEIKNNVEESIKKIKTTLNKINNVIHNEENPRMNVCGLLENAKTAVNLPWYLSKNEETSSIPKLNINEDVYKMLNDSITLEGTGIEYKLLPTDEIKDTEIPPAPAAPIFPPEIVKDVREFYKPKQLPNIDKPKDSFIKHVPKYRSKSGSTSSVNSVGLEISANKNLHQQNDYDCYQLKSPSSSSSVEDYKLKCLQEGSQDLVYVSHIIDPYNFFVQKSNQQAMVKEMIREFRNSAKYPQPVSKQVQEGKIFLLYNEKEKEWHRCRVMKIVKKENNEQPLYQVFSIDFGNTEYVTIDRLRVIPAARAQSPPPLAIHCSLANCQSLAGTWTSDDAILMQKIIDNKQVIICVRGVRNTVAHGPILECDVFTFDDCVNLALALAFHERSRLRNPKLEYPVVQGLEDKPKIYLSNGDFDPKTVENVQITHIVSPDKFYVRKCHLQDVYDRLSQDLNNTYSLRSTAGSVYCPTEGMVCVVNVDKYSEQVSGEGWRRAIVRGTPGRGRVRLWLIDSGETVLVHWSTLRHIKPQFTKSKALSVECHLSGVTPYNKRWNADSLALLESYQSKILELRADKTAHASGSVGVILYYNTDDDEQICINAEMIRYKYAINVGPLTFDRLKLDETVYTKNIPGTKMAPKPKSKKTKVTILKHNEQSQQKVNEQELEAKDKGPIKLEVKILSCKSPSLIYVSLIDQQKTFKELFDAIQTYYKKPNNTNGKKQWNIGDRCCTICTESKTWRRAAIVELNEENAKVFYIDFAVAESVNIDKLRELPEEFSKIGGAAIACHLSGVVPAGDKDWPSLTKEYLRDLIDAYQRFFITKNGTIKDKSLPIELWVYHITQGSALEPNTAEWRCLNKKIIEQGLGVPDNADMNYDSNAENSCSDSVISFFNISGTIGEWLQVESLTEEFLCDLPVAFKKNNADSKNDSPMEIKGTLDNLQNVSSSQTDEQKSSATKTQNDRQTVMISDWLPPEPLNSNEFTGIPTNVDDSGVIYLHDISQEENLSMIANALEVRFKDTVARPADTYWSVGQPCIARFYLDEKYYRGRVLAVNDENRTCSVHYVDYGNEEICSVDGMRKNLVLWQIPIQAQKCVLNRVKPIKGKWDTSTLDYIHKMIVEKNCLVRVSGEKIEDSLPVEIKVGPLWLSEHLVDLEMAVFTDGSKLIIPNSYINLIDENKTFATPQEDTDPDYIIDDDTVSDLLNESKDSINSSNIIQLKDWNKIIAEEENEKERAILMYPKREIKNNEFICSVAAIYNDKFELMIVNDNETTAQLDIIQEKIQESINNLQGIDGVYENKACVALFKDDNKWYRASILEYSEAQGSVKVKFVDFGDVNLLDISEVRETLDELVTIPAAVVTAKIFGVTLNPEMEHDMDEFYTTFLDKEFHTTVIKSDDEFIYVELRNEKDGQLAYQNLIDKQVLVYLDKPLSN